MTPLAQRIGEAIRANGPMPVSLYMLMCLHDPRDGYYATRPAFNQDFTTGPETSQVFGELVGLWAAHEWRAIGSPAPFLLVELGPGRGTMMVDMLRAGRIVPGFVEAARLALVEASPALRREQEERLKGYPHAFYDELDAVPNGPMILVGNEFLDCMSVRQYVRTKDGWHERQIGLGDGWALRFGIGPPADPPDFVKPQGDHLEAAPALEALVATLGRKLQAQPGRALLIDYGPDDGSPGETLRAYRLGEQVDPLAAPGECDLTADVDFLRLKRLAEKAGLAVHGPIGQGSFLRRLGIEERGKALAAANQDRAEEIAAAVVKLTAAEQMGERFKAVCLSPTGAPRPPGFQSGVRV